MLANNNPALSQDNNVDPFSPNLVNTTSDPHAELNGRTPRRHQQASVSATPYSKDEKPANSATPKLTISPFQPIDGSNCNQSILWHDKCLSLTDLNNTLRIPNRATHSPQMDNPSTQTGPAATDHSDDLPTPTVSPHSDLLTCVSMHISSLETNSLVLEPGQLDSTTSPKLNDMVAKPLPRVSQDSPCTNAYPQQSTQPQSSKKRNLALTVPPRKRTKFNAAVQQNARETFRPSISMKLAAPTANSTWTENLNTSIASLATATNRKSTRINYFNMTENSLSKKQPPWTTPKTHCVENPFPYCMANPSSRMDQIHERPEMLSTPTRPAVTIHPSSVQAKELSQGVSRISPAAPNGSCPLPQNGFGKQCCYGKNSPTKKMRKTNITDNWKSSKPPTFGTVPRCTPSTPKDHKFHSLRISLPAERVAMATTSLPMSSLTTPTSRASMFVGSPGALRIRGLRTMEGTLSEGSAQKPAPSFWSCKPSQPSLSKIQTSSGLAGSLSRESGPFST